VDFHYDDNGNLLSRMTSTLFPTALAGAPGVSGGPVGDDLALYSYDAWNNLVTAETSGTVTVNGYNGVGLRVSKTVAGLTMYYGYEYNEVVLEVDGDGVQIAFNMRGVNLVARVSDGNTTYFMYNGHADVVALTDGGNTVLASYYYDAFGVHRENNGGENNPYRYAGYMFDEETGLYYLKARFYDPELARFLQEDTYRGQLSDPLSLNLYAYVRYNPLMYWDPTGHWEAGDSDLPIGVQMELLALTNAWYAAFSQAERNKIHDQAVELRRTRKPSNDYTYTKTDQTVMNDINTITKMLDEIVNHGEDISSTVWWKLMDRKDSISVYTNSSQLEIFGIGLGKTTSTITFFGRTGVYVNQNSYKSTASLPNITVAYRMYNKQEALYMENMMYAAWYVYPYSLGDPIPDGLFIDALVMLDYLEANSSNEDIPDITKEQAKRLLWYRNLNDGYADFYAQMSYMSYDFATQNKSIFEEDQKLRAYQRQDAWAAIGILSLQIASYQSYIWTPVGQATGASSIIPKTSAEWLEMTGVNFKTFGSAKNPVIGRMKDLGKIGSNEYRVSDLLPDQGSAKDNWKQNSSVLRYVMNQGTPIRDASEFSYLDPKLGVAGTENYDTFLHMERNLLYEHGWRYNSGYWYPPK
jgi:RHS repeat-associated protein